MKTLLMAAVATGLLCGCTKVTPVEVTVPSDSSVLHGDYMGTMKELRSSTYGPEVAARLSSTATYVSKTQYRANGTLNVEGKTYTFTGLGVGHSGVTFKPQWSPPYPVINFDADLFLNGEKVGTLSNDQIVTASTGQQFIMLLGSQRYTLELDQE